MNSIKCNGCCKNMKEISYRDGFLENQVLYCNECGHIQLQRIPSPKEIAEFYNLEYSEERKSFVNQEYFNIMKKRAKAQYQYIKKYIDNKLETVLDIGSGYGYLLNVMKSEIPNINGVEFDPLCIEYIKKTFDINTKQVSSEDDILSKEKSYDLITMSHSLEHFLDVDKIVYKIKRNSKYIFIEVPKYDIKLKEQFVNQEGHINFFTEKSLVRLFERHNLKILNVGSYGPSMSVYWKDSFKLFAYFQRRFLKKDWFLNQYEKENKEGIWIRILLEVKND